MAITRKRRGGVVLGLTMVLLLGACSEAEDGAAPDGDSSLSGSGAAGSLDMKGYTPTGKLIADTGFRPEKDGFAFENYGEAPKDAPPRPDLTPADVRKLFGDGVCRILSGDRCELVPQAEAWMETTNNDMKGGHCYGFSVGSNLLFQGKESASTFGAESIGGLSIDDNPALSRYIAYTWAHQTLENVGANKVVGTPSAVLEKLVSSLKPEPEETYTIGIYKRDGNGGHAITPYAVEDKGDGTFGVLVYDNNFPGVTRVMTVDREKDTWSYVASTNPEEEAALYEGDAETGSFQLLPTNPGLGTQPCPFCGEVPAKAGEPLGRRGAGGSVAAAPGATTAAEEPDLDLIYMDGSEDDHGHLLITDDQGRQIGFKDGKLVNTIPGAQVKRAFSTKPWLDAAEPDYYVPTGKTYTILLDGTGVKETDPTTIGIISSSFEMLADDIQLDPGQKDVLTVGPFGTSLSYKTDRPETPTLEIGIADDLADYVFAISGESYEAGSSINLTLPLDSSEGLLIDTNVESGESRFDIVFLRTDESAEEVFTHEDIELNGEDAAVLLYADWDDEGEGIPYAISRNGEITTEVLTDSK